MHLFCVIELKSGTISGTNLSPPCLCFLSTNPQKVLHKSGTNLNYYLHVLSNEKNIRYSLLGPAWKSTQRHICLNYLPWSMLLETRYNVHLSTSDCMTVLLLNYVTKSAMFTRPWMMFQSVITFQRRIFQKHDYKIDQFNRIFTKYNLLGRQAWQ